MAKKYYVLKPFTYAGKQYVRGDEFDAEGLGMHSSKIEIRVKAHLLVEESRLTPAEKAKLLRDRTVAKATVKPANEPKVEQKQTVVEEPKSEPQTDEPTLFSTNVGGGKGKNKNRNN